MSLITMDGFDDRTSLARHGVESFNGAGTSAGQGVFGTQAANCSQNNLGVTYNITQMTASHTDPTIIFGFSVKPTIVVDADVDGIVYLYGDAGAVNHITIDHNGGDRFEIRRGAHNGTIIATTSTLNMGVGVEHYFEVKIKIHDTTGTVDVHQNGVSVCSETGLDTKNGGTNDYIDIVRFQGSATRFYLDDVYIANSQGSVNNDFLGPQHVNTYFPDAEGTTIQYTPSTGTDNSATIDENPAPNTTDYNDNGTVGQLDELSFQPISGTPTVAGIQLTLYAQKTDVAARAIRNRLDSDTFVATGADHLLSTSWDWYSDVFETDPDGGGAWTAAQFNAAEFGYETRA